MRTNGGQSIGLNVSGQGLTQQTQNLTGPEKFQQTLLGVTSAVAGAAGAAAPFFPGGAVVSAALSGFSNVEQKAMGMNSGVGAFGAGNSVGGGGGGGSYGGGGMPGVGGGGSYGGGGMPGATGGGGTATTPEAQMQQMQQQNMYFLQMQQQANQTSEQFSALSNLMKVRHDTNQGILQDIK